MSDAYSSVRPSLHSRGLPPLISLRYKFNLLSKPAATAAEKK